MLLKVLRLTIKVVCAFVVGQSGAILERESKLD